jgi:AhpD family alkylhydroperoxidase
VFIFLVVGETGFWLVKRRQALVETNLSRNSRLELIERDQAEAGVMAGRLEYWKLAPQGIERLREVGQAVATGSSLEPVLLELVRVLVSRRNGCAKCTHVHEAELRKMHEPAERMEGVGEWRTAGADNGGAYTRRERAALAWAEAVTDIQDAALREAAKTAVREHFTDAEIANLTLAIAAINAWNRMEIGSGPFEENADRKMR